MFSKDYELLKLYLLSGKKINIVKYRHVDGEKIQELKEIAIDSKEKFDNIDSMIDGFKNDDVSFVMQCKEETGKEIIKDLFYNNNMYHFSKDFYQAYCHISCNRHLLPDNRVWGVCKKSYDLMCYDLDRESPYREDRNIEFQVFADENFLFVILPVNIKLQKRIELSRNKPKLKEINTHKCIKCGIMINPEYKHCNYCGKNQKKKGLRK